MLLNRPISQKKDKVKRNSKEMSKLSEIDLGSSILSISILLGFIATSLVIIRLLVRGINYIKINSKQKQESSKPTKEGPIDKGFNWQNQIPLEI